MDGETAKTIRGNMQRSRDRLIAARDRLQDAKLACEKNAAALCSHCQEITCEEVKENCKLAMDEFGNYIGGAVNRLGKEIPLFSENFSNSGKSSSDLPLGFIKKKTSCNNTA